MELVKEPRYRIITELQKLPDDAILALDFETKPNTYIPEIASFYWSTGSGVIDIEASGKDSYELVFKMVDSAKYLLAHNVSFELQVLRYMGYDIRKLYKKIMDTMLMLHCLNTENELGLKAHGDTVGMDLSLDWKTAHKLSREEYIQYCQDDSEACYKLAYHLLPQLKDNKVETPYLMELEMVWVILSLTDNGILVDKEFLLKLQTETEEKVKVVKKSLIEIAGKIINFKSGKQLGDILFKDLGAKLLPEYQTEKGNISVKETIIVDIKKKSKDPKVASFCENLLVFKELSKFRDAFLSEKFLSLIHPDGRIRSDFWSTGTATSRFANSKPNIQQTPSQGDGVIIRKAYIAGKGNVLICADLSQAEYRFLAHYSGDPELIKAYVEGKLDIHDIVMKELDVPRIKAKCFVEGTIIRTNEGDKPIEEIAVPINDTFHTPYHGSYKCIDYSGEEIDILSTYYETNVKETIIFELDNGDIIEVTPDHRMIVMRDRMIISVSAIDVLDTDEFISID